MLFSSYHRRAALAHRLRYGSGKVGNAIHKAVKGHLSSSGSPRSFRLAHQSKVKGPRRVNIKVATPKKAPAKAKPIMAKLIKAGPKKSRPGIKPLAKAANRLRVNPVANRLHQVARLGRYGAAKIGQKVGHVARTIGRHLE